MNKFFLGIALTTLAFQLSAGEISRKDYGKKWPFTVEKGDLSCRKNAVFFVVDGTAYAVNGVASAQGYQDITPIWREDPEFLEYTKQVAKEEKKTLAEVQKITGILRVNISPVLNAGLELCN